MTWRLLRPIWRLEGVTASQRLVLLALASFTDQRGANAYPSQGTLARMCCCNRSTVHRAVKALENRQLIQRTGTGRKGTIRYSVVVPMQQDMPHHASPASRTVQHNPSKVITSNYPSEKGDSYFDQFSADSLDRLDSAGAIQRIDARRKRNYGR
jgi:DNA-binding transcriptional MocR family regulator